MQFAAEFRNVNFCVIVGYRICSKRLVQVSFIANENNETLPNCARQEEDVGESLAPL